MIWKQLEAKVLKRVENFDPYYLNDAINEVITTINNSLNRREIREVFSSVTGVFTAIEDDTTEIDLSAYSFTGDNMSVYKVTSIITSMTPVEDYTFDYETGIMILGTGIDTDDVLTVIGTGSEWATVDFTNRTITFNGHVKELKHVFVGGNKWELQDYEFVFTNDEECYFIENKETITFSTDFNAEIEDGSIITIDGTFNYSKIDGVEEIDIPESLDEMFVHGVLSFVYSIPEYQNDDRLKYHADRFYSMLNSMGTIYTNSNKIPDKSLVYNYWS